ncbi:Oidioi.mRNA.OKI2018_I69.chr2.g4140.t1.cds [Oikopleura dioica]|uniref:Oidioi.mRNA.OKI2018_I69.chr2.g4140.t1.cds n=1 Tax=Oikopleura dioica TaxID=34765 RepID=A0ABN7T0M1_OIKDI|nr:Oidioi.mRNA.OKI2018_I69.chr2.g4140.t1.cds [Oikopleura dioica]
MSLLSRWSKSTENLREKSKKWNIAPINLKTKTKKIKANKLAISKPIDYTHTAGVDKERDECFTIDESQRIVCTTAEILKREKSQRHLSRDAKLSVVREIPERARAASPMRKSTSSEDIFADIESKIGSMNILDDIMSMLKDTCPSVAQESVFSSSALDSTFDQSDGTSLAASTCYTSDTESRGTGYSSASVDETESITKSIALSNARHRRKNLADLASQKDSFYSTTDISQCETDREVPL